MVEVTEADRNASWATRPEAFREEGHKTAWMNGVYDHSRHIKSYAAHRAAAAEEVLNKARAIYHDYSSQGMIREANILLAFIKLFEGES